MSLAYHTPPAGLAAVQAGHVLDQGGQDRNARYFARLEQALEVALAPLDFPNIQSWSTTLGSTLSALAGGRSGGVLLPGASGWMLVSGDALGRRSHDETTERLAIGAELGGDAVLWVRDDLTDSKESVLDGWYPRFAIGLRVRTATGAIAALYVERDPAHGAIDHQVVAAFRAIAPAFVVGVNAWAATNACRTSVEGMLDSLGDAAILFDVDGALVHANPALDRLGQAAASRVRDEAQRVAWALGAVARRRSVTAVSSSARATAPADAHTSRTVRLGAAAYELRGSIVGESLLGPRPAVLVTVTTSTTEPLTDDDLRRQYGLTTREIEVARLVAAGLSNNEIGERLGVKFFTARNPVERALSKLGVASRHRVGPLLRNEGVDAAA